MFLFKEGSIQRSGVTWENSMLWNTFLVISALQLNAELLQQSFVLLAKQRVVLISLWYVGKAEFPDWCASFPLLCQGLHYHYFELGKNTDPEKESDPQFNAAFTVHPVLDPLQMYRLHRHFARVELEHTYQEIQQLQVRWPDFEILGLWVTDPRVPLTHSLLSFIRKISHVEQYP